MICDSVTSDDIKFKGNDGLDNNPKNRKESVQPLSFLHRVQRTFRHPLTGGRPILQGFACRLECRVHLHESCLRLMDAVVPPCGTHASRRQA